MICESFRVGGCHLPHRRNRLTRQKMAGRPTHVQNRSSKSSPMSYFFKHPCLQPTDSRARACGPAMQNAMQNALHACWSRSAAGSCTTKTCRATARSSSSGRSIESRGPWPRARDEDASANFCCMWLAIHACILPVPSKKKTCKNQMKLAGACSRALSLRSCFFRELGVHISRGPQHRPSAFQDRTEEVSRGAIIRLQMTHCAPRSMYDSAAVPSSN